MTVASLKTATDDEIHRALKDANIPTLLVVISQLEQDLSLLEGDELPSNSIDGVSRMTDARQEAIRDRAFRLLAALRDGTFTPPPLPDTNALQRMASVYLNQHVEEEYIPMMLSEMGFKGSPLDSVRWQQRPPETQLAGFKVVIIGAGISGLCAAAHLDRAGIPFEIFEKNPTVGGTWYENTYPDCGVDTPNHFYSFSFEPNADWSRFYSKQPEILGYLKNFAAKYDLLRHIRFSTEVESAVYDEAKKRWVLSIKDTEGKVEQIEANVLLSAVGQLNRPKVPEFPGKDDFSGPAFHCANWLHDCDLSGKRVAVIGTGASAMQLAPAIAPDVAKLTIFQRSPHWIRILPDYHRQVSQGKAWLLDNIPYYRNWYRFRLFWSYGDGVWQSLHKDPDWPHQDRSLNSENEHHRNIYVRKIREALNHDEALIEKVIPNYPPFAKRMLIDNGWCEMLQRDNVELLCSGVSRIERNAVVDDNGAAHDADVIIYATGFDAHNFLAPIDVRGRNGKSLTETWQDDPSAYLGMTTPGFPNLFLLFGPHTNLAHGGSAVFHVECQARYITECLMHLIEKDYSEVEVKEQVNDDYNRRVDAEHNVMVWTHPGVRNWYRNSKGRVISISPWRLVDYWSMTRHPDFNDYHWERSSHGWL